MPTTPNPTKNPSIAVARIVVDDLEAKLSATIQRVIDHVAEQHPGIRAVTVGAPHPHADDVCVGDIIAYPTGPSVPLYVIDAEAASAVDMLATIIAGARAPLVPTGAIDPTWLPKTWKVTR